MSENSKSNNRKKGSWSENLVDKYLKKQGHKIISKNFRSPLGEIDIIFWDHDEIVFSEIKSRTSLKYGFPVESVTFRKKQHIIRTARYFLHLHHLEDCHIRFDIIEVYLYKNQKPIIHPIQNVFW